MKQYLIIILRFYRSLLLKTDKDLFCILFNLRSLIIRSPSRVTWKDNIFIITDKKFPDYTYAGRHQACLNLFFEWGFLKSSISIGEAYFLDKINFKDGDIVIDCGANIGILKNYFFINNLDINYIGFEPSETEFNCLKDNVNPSTVHNFGLWNRNTELKFYINSSNGDSSIIKPIEFDKTTSIQVRRLEEYIDTSIKCLKLEAEGAEPEIIEGLGSKLSLVEYITADLGPERGVNEESTLVPVTNLLLNKGFELVEVQYPRICALFKNKNFDNNS